MNNYEKIKNMTIDEFLNSMINLINKDEDCSNQQKIYQAIFKEDGVDYKQLYLLLPQLDEDDISLILRYDKDYKISFLLSLVDFADEDDLTKQAIFLLRRHNLKYIMPLLPYVDEDDVRDEYIRLSEMR